MKYTNFSFMAKTLVAALALAAGAAQADIAITAGPAPANLTDNVIFTNSCDQTPVVGPATLVKGCLNQQQNVVVDLEGNGTELLQINNAQSGGQASLVATDGGFDYLKIYLDPLATSAFTLLAFNVDAQLIQGHGNATGEITINAVDTNGVSHTQTFALDTAGENKFLVEAFNGQLVNFVEFFTSGATITTIDFSDVKQVRIGGIGGSQVPEPGSLALAGIALLAAANARRRRSST